MRVLMDTGPWVALIDRSEGRHEECVSWFRQFKGQILTTEAVLTEILYLLGFSLKAQLGAMDFVLQGSFVLIPTDLNSLRRAKGLMTKYSDVPMDYAGATLVSLGEEISLTNIVTFDGKGFSTYRLSSKRPFTILP